MSALALANASCRKLLSSDYSIVQSLHWLTDFCGHSCRGPQVCAAKAVPAHGISPPVAEAPLGFFKRTGSQISWAGKNLGETFRWMNLGHSTPPAVPDKGLQQNAVFLPRKGIIKTKQMSYEHPTYTQRLLSAQRSPPNLASGMETGPL